MNGRRFAALAWAMVSVGFVGCHGAPAAEAPKAPAPAPKAATSASAPDAGAPVPSSAATPVDAAPASVEPPAPPEPPKSELPRGGRELFPSYRLVGFCGTPGAPALGRLMGKLDVQSKKIRDLGEKYARGRKPMPVFELIAVIVMGAPGADRKSRRRVPTSVVDEYLQAARAAKGILLLNIQPGHSDFLTEAKHYERYLKEPDVGLALDPEWQMHGKQKPGAIFGQTTGAAINAVADYLSEIVKANDLPEKALVFHQVNNHVVKDESVLTAHPGVALVKSVDGLGPKASKIVTYKALTKTMASPVHAGFKLFFDEDTANGNKLMTPDEVMALAPEPEYVMYE